MFSTRSSVTRAFSSSFCDASIPRVLRASISRYSSVLRSTESSSWMRVSPFLTRWPTLTGTLATLPVIRNDTLLCRDGWVMAMVVSLLCPAAGHASARITANAQRSRNPLRMPTLTTPFVFIGESTHPRRGWANILGRGLRMLSDFGHFFPHSHAEKPKCRQDRPATAVINFIDANYPCNVNYASGSPKFARNPPIYPHSRA